MAVFTAEQFKSHRTMVVPQAAGAVMCQYAEVAVPNTLAANDILRLCKLPPNCVLVDVVLSSDTIDTDGAVRLRVAIEDPSKAAGAEDILTGSELTAAANPATAVSRMATFPAAILQSADNLKTSRAIVAKVTTAGTTKVAGTVRLWMTYRHSDFGK